MKIKDIKISYTIAFFSCLFLIVFYLWWYFNSLILDEIGSFSIVFKTNTIYLFIFSIICYAFFFVPIFLSGISVQKKLNSTFNEDFVHLFDIINKIGAIVLSLFLFLIFYDELHLKAISFINAQSFNELAPLSNRDIGYFIFQRPFLLALSKNIFIALIASFCYSIFMYIAGFEIYGLYLRKKRAKNIQYVQIKNLGQKTFWLNPKFYDIMELQESTSQELSKTTRGGKLKKKSKFFDKVFFVRDINEFYTKSGLNKITLQKILFVLYTIFNIIKKNYKKLIENDHSLKDLLAKLSLIITSLILLYYLGLDGIIYSNFWGLEGVGYIEYSYWNIGFRALIILSLVLLITNIYFIKNEKLKIALKISFTCLALPLATLLFYYIVYFFSINSDNYLQNSKFIQYNIQNTSKAYNIDGFYQNHDISLSTETEGYLDDYFRFTYEKALEEKKREDQISDGSEDAFWERTKDIFEEYDIYAKDVTEILQSLNDMNTEVEGQTPEETQQKAMEKISELLKKSSDVTSGLGDTFDEVKQELEDFPTRFKKMFGGFDKIFSHSDMRAMITKELEFDDSVNKSHYNNFMANPLVVKENDELKLSILSPRESLRRNFSPNNYDVEFQDTHGYGADLLNLLGQNIYGFQRGTKEMKISKEYLTPNIDRFQIYYGKNIRQSAITNTRILENDNFGKNNHTYQGSGGLYLNGFNKFLTSLYLKIPSLLFDSNVSERSKALLNRNIIDRAKQALPFLYIDENPYMIISDEGTLKWIIDAYTFTNKYPFSNKTMINRQEIQDINYIKNSVKIVIDAYDGKLDAYAIDQNDPILRMYQKAYPGIIKNAPLPEYVQENAIYPVNLLKLKFEIFERYNKENRSIEDFVSNANVKTLSNYKLNNNFKSNIYYSLLDVTGDNQKNFVTIIPIRKYTSEQTKLDRLIIVLNGMQSNEQIGIYNFID